MDVCYLVVSWRVDTQAPFRADITDWDKVNVGVTVHPKELDLIGSVVTRSLVGLFACGMKANRPSDKASLLHLDSMEAPPVIKYEVVSGDTEGEQDCVTAAQESR